MTVPVWVAEHATWFWTAAGEPEPFPRKLLGPIAEAVPLTVVFPPRPTIASIVEWLRENGIRCNSDTPDRRLRGCLVARDGHGFAFIDGTDSEDEQRFSLAHELAHFLRDYLYPRRRIEQSLGPTALEVLDGQRTATPHERLHALLSSTPIGYHVHFMDRDAETGSPSRNVADAEGCADRLAYELLAPADCVMAAFDGWTKPASAATLVELLSKRYGLPTSRATRYAEVILGPVKKIDPFLARLRGVY